MNKFRLTIDTESINLENEIHINNFSNKIKNLIFNFNFFVTFIYFNLILLIIYIFIYIRYILSY